jgi:mono/diheme cytochrome c family protein
MKKYISFLFASLFLFALMSFVSRSQNDPWPVPDKYKNMPNPVKSDAASIASGKALYNQHCKSCHGTKGKGDGPKAEQLNTECGDFTKPATQSETDGALFYKTSEGRKDMPSFKKKIADQNDIWAVVNYIRTLK